MNASDLRPPSAEELRQRAATLRVVAWAMANGTHSIEALKNAADECETSAARLEAGEKERGDEGLIESMSKTMDFLRTVKCPGMCPYPDICEKAGRCTYAAPSGAGERSAEAEAGEGGGSGAVATPANKSAEDAPVADAREHANPTTLAPSPVISGSAGKPAGGEGDGGVDSPRGREDGTAQRSASNPQPEGLAAMQITTDAAGVAPGPSPDPAPRQGPRWCSEANNWCIDMSCTDKDECQVKSAPTTSAPTGDAGARRDAIGEEFAQLAKFYAVTTLPDLVRAQEEHVRRLQEKLRDHGVAPFMSFVAAKVREG